MRHNVDEIWITQPLYHLFHNCNWELGMKSPYSTSTDPLPHDDYEVCALGLGGVAQQLIMLLIG